MNSKSATRIISLPLNLFSSVPVLTKTDKKLQGVADFTWRSIGCRVLLKEHLRLKSEEDLTFISKQCHCSCLCQLTQTLASYKIANKWNTNNHFFFLMIFMILLLIFIILGKVSLAFYYVVCFSTQRFQLKSPMKTGFQLGSW